MDEPFAVGDQVILKSGSPTMTVERILSGSGDVRCTWFTDDPNPSMQNHSFPPAQLAKWKPSA